MRGVLPVLAVLVLAPACAQSRADSPTTTVSTTRARPPTQATVVILGDSISRLSEPAIDDLLEDGYELVHQSRDGTTIAEQTSRAALHAPGGPGRQADAMLIELGTNDVTGATADPIKDLRRLANLVADVPCVVWYSVVTIPLRTDLTLIAMQLNRELRRMADDDPHFSFRDLVGPVYGRPGAVGLDSVHPTARGSRYLARVYAKDLVEKCHLGPVPR